MPPRRHRDRRRRMCRFGSPITGRRQRASPVAGDAGGDEGELVAGQQAAVDLVWTADLFKPGGAFREILFRAAQIDDADTAEPAFGLDQFVHVVPQPHGLDRQRDLAGIAAHFAAPAPVAAGLFGRDLTFFAEDHLDAVAGEKERGAHADDAAADDHDRGAGRLRGVGWNVIERLRHQSRRHFAGTARLAESALKTPAGADKGMPDK